MKVIPNDPLIDEVAHSELVHDGARTSILNVLKGRGFEFGVEVGVQYGQGSEKWLDNNVIFKMYGIDPYMSDIGQISPLHNRDADTYGFAMGKLMRFGDRYIHIRKTSIEALVDVPKTVDFVYLDAGKDKKSIMDDLSFWFPKIKTGGIMFGHDYDHPSYPHMTGIVDDYFGFKPNVEPGGIWWVEKKDTFNPQRQVSVVTPFYNAGFYAGRMMQNLDDPRIDEIIIVDDGSIQGESDMLKFAIEGNPKVQYVRRDENLGELRTRIQGAEMTRNEWVIFLDDDNTLLPEYLDEIYRIPKWRSDVIYCPDFGNKKHINYKVLAGEYLTKDSIKKYIREHKYLIPMFLNTGNYFMNVTSYLETAKPLADTPKHEYGDIIVNGEWLKKGLYMYVVEGMGYLHRTHKNSTWKEHAKEMQVRIDGVINELR